MNTQDIIEQYSNAVEVIKQLPHAQFAQPNSEDPNKYPYGLFIEEEQAIKSEFKYSKNQIVETKINSSTTLKGLVFTKLNLSIITMGQTIIQAKDVSYDSNGKLVKKWLFMDVAYTNKGKTEACELAKKDSQNYRIRQNFVILLLDENNNPLHKVPFKFSPNGGSGMAFKNEIQAHLEDCSKKMSEWIKKPIKIKPENLAYFLMNIKLSYHRKSDYNPYIIPVERLSLVPTTENQYSRAKIVLTNTPEKIVVNRKEKLGEIILENVQNYEDYFNYNKNNQENDEAQDTEIPLKPIEDSYGEIDKFDLDEIPY